MEKAVRYDHIGYWSEVKLDIIREYATQYSRILSKQERLQHLYIDAFAGAGVHLSKESGDFVLGSPLNALEVRPPFWAYHFIDLDVLKVQNLESLAGKRVDVFIYHGDCNRILIESVFPKARYEDYKRALCVLDPYGLHLEWEVIRRAGRMNSIDMFLNFPVADINRNVLWRNIENVPQSQIDRMNRFWGDDSWKQIAYRPARQKALFNDETDEKASNDDVAAAFQKRLTDAAGFKYVPDPIAMRNTQNAVVYYLFFASNNPVAKKIVKHIFQKYKNRKGQP